MDVYDNLLVIVSGGMDSFTLLHHMMLNNPKAKVRVLSFNYNQRHKKELDYAAKITDALGVQHIIFDMPGLGTILNGSSLTSDIAVPEGHYAAPNMKLTVVPGRNTIMLSIAMGAAEAWARQTDEKVAVCYGAHAGDHTIYPDCRPDYYHAMKQVFWEATEGQVELFAPYINMTKNDILYIGKRLHLDYSLTWSCYNGLERPCGRCGACTERAEAFAVNNMVDPWFLPDVASVEPPVDISVDNEDISDVEQATQPEQSEASEPQTKIPAKRVRPAKGA